MSISVPTNKRAYLQRPMGDQGRKVAIVGTSPKSFHQAPFTDWGWEIWAHSSAGMMVPRADLFIDQHPAHCFQEERKNGFSNYYEWLKQSRVPILMDKKYKEIPASIGFPQERMKAEWPDVRVGSQTAMLVWYAMSQGVKTIGLYGVEYSHSELERRDQRESTVEWIGIARGAGVKVVIPRVSSLSHVGIEDYAWQTHSTPEKYAAIKAKFAEAQAKGRGAMPATIPANTQAERDAAFALACELDPDFAAEVARMKESDPPMPTELLLMEIDVLRAEVARLTALTSVPR